MMKIVSGFESINTQDKEYFCVFKNFPFKSCCNLDYTVVVLILLTILVPPASSIKSVAIRFFELFEPISGRALRPGCCDFKRLPLTVQFTPKDTAITEGSKLILYHYLFSGNKKM